VGGGERGGEGVGEGRGWGETPQQMIIVSTIPLLIII
jgi:hypothetical protein